MQKLYFFFLLFFCSVLAYGQAQKGTVYLKNGSIINGKFSYSNDMEKLMVHSSGNTWVFDQADVEKVETKGIKNNEGLTPSVFGKAEMGVAIGNSENSKSAPFSFTASMNYYLLNTMTVGIGVGAEFLEESYLPAFANVEYHFRSPSSSPFLFIKGGYMVPLDNTANYYGQEYPVTYDMWSSYYIPPEPLETRGGMFINPGFGYMRVFEKGFGLSLAFGYQFHNLNYSGEDEYEFHVNSNRLTLKIGVIIQ